MSADRRKNDRISFERGFPAVMTAHDRSWQRACLMDDVSDGGARLTVKDSVDGLNLKEFTLLLSANGQAVRHCQLSWVKGQEIGVRFLKVDRKKRVTREGAPVAAKPAAPVVEV